MRLFSLRKLLCSSRGSELYCKLSLLPQIDQGASTALTDLEKRIQALEVGAQYDATKIEVQKVEAEFLLKLREIQAALNIEQGGSLLSAAASKELEALRSENEVLKAKNAKLEYRVKHVVDEMEKLYEEAKRNKEISNVGSQASF